MSTSVGEVTINLRLSMAKFQTDVQQSSSAVKQSSDQMASAVSDGAGKSREALRLITEEMGIRMPRALQGFIAGLPGVSTALNSAFTGVAIVAVIGLIIEIIAKIQEFKQHAADVQAALDNIGEGGADSLRKLQERTLELNKQFDELTGNKVAALKDALQQVNNARLDDLKGQVAAVSKEVDGLTSKMKQSTTFNLISVLWGGTDPNAGIQQVRDFFEQIQKNLNQFVKSGNVDGYGKTLASALEQAEGAATGLSKQGPQVRQAWAGVAEYLAQLQTSLKDTNENASKLALNTSLADASKRADELAENVGKVGTAWLDVQGKIATKSTDPTADIQKHLDDALATIEHFGVVAQGTWSEFDIAAAKSSATTRAYANELGQLLKLMQEFPATTRDIKDPFGPMVQTAALVVQNSTSLQQQLAAVKQGGQAADEATTQLTDAIETQQQKWRTEIQIYQALYSQGRITQQQLTQATQAATAAADNSDKSWTRLGHTLGSDVNSALQQLISGTKGWSTALEEAVQKMILAVAEMEIMKALNDSSFFGGLAGGKLFGSGGIFNGRAEGGPVEANVPYWVGERRTPELFVPSVPGHIVPMSQVGGGGSSQSVNIVQNISTPDANSFGLSQKQLLSDAYGQARVASAQNRGR